MLVDFLKTKRTKEELTLTFDILNEFKKCESSTEWGFHPFESWKRLEQFQDYLALLIEEKEYELQRYF